MGEYAKLINGQEIKIGTCEQMYYLRADQVSLIEPVSGSVNPRRRDEAESIRFRFPFPDEDDTKPGAFEPYDRAFPVWDVEPPEDIKHYNLQFTRNYPSSGGILLSTPCPRSKEGKASGFKWGYNGYSGPVGIHSQRLVGEQLVLILRCMDCGALWRVPSLEEAKPILEKLTEDEHSRKIAMRIIDGYTKPNYWTKELIAA